NGGATVRSRRARRVPGRAHDERLARRPRARSVVPFASRESCSDGSLAPTRPRQLATSVTQCNHSLTTTAWHLGVGRWPTQPTNGRRRGAKGPPLLARRLVVHRVHSSRCDAAPD